YGMAKRRTERMVEKPLAARRGGYLRQQKRDTDDQTESQSKPFSPRKSFGQNKTFKKF
ncbi:MAG TPA: 23S rRNA pseudouridylate synthase B, partial [Acinetobacter ursingii]|nr:23S rRNA pseudouridylate synthase B [Acinetobacter ursingii]